MTTMTRPLLPQSSSLSSAPHFAPHRRLRGSKTTMKTRRPHPYFPPQDDNDDDKATSPFTIDCYFYPFSLSPPNCRPHGSTTATSTTPAIPLHPPVDPNRHAERRAVVPDDDAAPLRRCPPPPPCWNVLLLLEGGSGASSAGH